MQVQKIDSSNEKALKNGTWVKLICGASNEDLPFIADLCAVYAALGVHCVDIAADLAVANAAREGLDWVQERYGKRPWLMISFSDGKDIHFRKAKFDPNLWLDHQLGIIKIFVKNINNLIRSYNFI